MDRSRIISAIEDFASRPKHVRFDELHKLMENHVSDLFPNYNHHGNPHHAYTIGSETFNVAEPHGTPFVKPKYVAYFLRAMEAVGLYAPEAKDR